MAPGQLAQISGTKICKDVSNFAVSATSILSSMRARKHARTVQGLLCCSEQIRIDQNFE
jgi:hypothetical protein